MAEERVVVIADDLTGANDSGAQVAKRGLETITFLDPARAAAAGCSGIVIDTESRSLSQATARERVRAAAAAVRSLRPTLLYKKIDSTLRGHIGTEIEVLIRELEPALVVCAPAYPKNGRITVGGRHYVHGVPLDRSEFAGDPADPIGTAELRSLLARGSRLRFTHVGIDALHGGFRPDRTGGLFSFDCETAEDLERIVALAAGRGAETLWCGSAGLAEAVLAAVRPGPDAPSFVGRGRYGQVDDEASPVPGGSAGPLLAVVGSASAVSSRQVEAALAAGGTELVRLDPASLAASATAECARLVSRLRAARARRLILAAPGGGPVEAASSPGGADSEAVADCLARAASTFSARRPLAGLFLTGGATAYRVARENAVEGMRIGSELEPGVPCVRFIGGALDGLPGVTKAGGFGDDATLLRSFAYLDRARRGML